jgi:O-antigen ligase
MWYIILALIALFQGVSFMVPLPQPIYYGTILLGFLVTVGKVDKFNKSIFFFLLVAVFGIFYNNIPSFFKSEQRLLIFIVVVSAIGPLFISRKSHVFRIKLFVILNRFIVVLSCLSFITYILGVSLPFSATGKNSGFFVHSLTLGPFAAVSFLLLVYVLYSKINVLNISTKILKICLFLSIMALLISSSRTSIIALVFALLFLSYKMYRHKVGKTFKMMFGLVIILSLSYPLWSTYTSGIISKFESTDNDLLASREAHWNSRLLEFKTSPITGVGIASALSPGEFAIGFKEESRAV